MIVRVGKTSKASHSVYRSRIFNLPHGYGIQRAVREYALHLDVLAFHCQSLYEPRVRFVEQKVAVLAEKGGILSCMYPAGRQHARKSSIKVTLEDCIRRRIFRLRIAH